MEITEEQRQRAEANRIAAIAKRKSALESGKESQVWKLFKCRKVSPEATAATNASRFPKPQNSSNEALLKPHLVEKFRARLEICSPDSFSITPEAVRGFDYPGEAECLKRLEHCLANVSFRSDGFIFMFLVPIKKWTIYNLEKRNRLDHYVF